MLFNNGQLDDLIKQYNTPDPTMKEYFEYVKEQKAAGKQPVDIATFRDKYSTTGREKLGLNMQWQAKTGADGKITLHGYQLGDRGTLHEVIDKDGQPLTVRPTEINTGTEIQFINPYTQEVVGRQPIDVTGKDLAGVQAKQAIQLPQADDATNRGANLVDQILDDVDSGKGDLVGNTGVRQRLGEASWWGSTGHTASQIEQLKDINFLEAYTMLRGGGNISDSEGIKAQNAFAALRNPQYLTPADLRTNLEVAKQSLLSANAAAHRAAGDAGQRTSGLPFDGGGVRGSHEGEATTLADGKFVSENGYTYVAKNGKLRFSSRTGAQ